MTWPPLTHQDVQDEIALQRGAHDPYIKAGSYSTGLVQVSTGAVNSTAFSNEIGARPFLLLAEQTFDRIAVHVQTASTAASGGTIGLALYTGARGQPGDLLLSTAYVSSETTGPKEFVIDVTLSPGIWWVGTSAKVANCGLSAAASGFNMFVGTSVPQPTGSAQGWVLQATSSWPATWPASPGTGIATQPAAHLISLRAA